MTNILRPYLRKFAVVYVDDILILSYVCSEHMQHLETILTTPCQHELFLQHKKFILLTSPVSFLRYVVYVDGIHMDDAKVKAKWIPLLSSVTQIRSFHKSASFYMRFIHDFDVIMTPITKLVNTKESPWTFEDATAFEVIKKSFLSSHFQILITCLKLLVIMLKDGWCHTKSKWPSDSFLYSKSLRYSAELFYL